MKINAAAALAAALAVISASFTVPMTGCSTSKEPAETTYAVENGVEYIDVTIQDTLYIQIPTACSYTMSDNSVEITNGIWVMTLGLEPAGNGVWDSFVESAEALGDIRECDLGDARGIYIDDGEQICVDAPVSDTEILYLRFHVNDGSDRAAVFYEKLPVFIVGNILLR